jgi:hypothetical protein
VKGEVQFVGWALHQSGIRDVSVFVDGNFLMKARTGLTRIDVGKAYLENEHALNAGWAALIATASLPPGPHEFVIQASLCDRSSSLVEMGRVARGVDQVHPASANVAPSEVGHATSADATATGTDSLVTLPLAKSARGVAALHDFIPSAKHRDTTGGRAASPAYSNQPLTSRMKWTVPDERFWTAT